jgi:hypothetical protein
VLLELGRHDHFFARRYTGDFWDVLPSQRLLKIVLRRVSESCNSTDTVLKRGEYNTQSEAFRITQGLIDLFYGAVVANGSVPIILVYPDIGDQVRFRDDRRKRYLPLLEHLESMGYRYVDALEGLAAYEEQHEVSDLTVEWGHFSPVAHEITADLVLRYLKDHGLGTVSELERLHSRETARFSSLRPERLASPESDEHALLAAPQPGPFHRERT